MSTLSKPDLPDTSNGQTAAATPAHLSQVPSKKIDVKSDSPFTSAEDVKRWIKSQAQTLGFGDCGFLSVHHPLFAQQMTQLQQWLAKGYEGQLQFMHNNHHLRAHPDQLVEGAKPSSVCAWII